MRRWAAHPCAFQEWPVHSRRAAPVARKITLKSFSRSRDVRLHSGGGYFFSNLRGVIPASGPYDVAMPGWAGEKSIGGGTHSLRSVAGAAAGATRRFCSARRLGQHLHPGFENRNCVAVASKGSQIVGHKLRTLNIGGLSCLIPPCGGHPYRPANDSSCQARRRLALPIEYACRRQKKAGMREASQPVGSETQFVITTPAEASSECGAPQPPHSRTARTTWR